MNNRRMGDLGTCGKIGKVVLVIINIIFALLGLTVLVAGALLKFKEGLINGEVSEFLKQIRLEHLETDLHTIVSTSAIIFICVGAFIFVLSMLGCIGACCQQKAVLIIYSVVVLIILGVQIAGIVITFQYKDEWQGSVKTEMKKVIKADYKGDNGTDFITFSINSAFMEFKCCGVDDYSDVYQASGWARNYTIANQQVTFIAPYFCCKNIKTETPVMDSELFKTVAEAECAINPTEENSNYKKGCYGEFKDIILRYSAIYIGVGIALLILEVFCILFACYLCCTASRQEGKLV